jgi:MoaA/NifB/PqqE/SkfB family radical SAM enzyme
MSELILDGHKLNWHKDRVEALLKGEKVAPITIDCSLTRRCTYRCVYCYGQLQANDEKKMTKDVIFGFLDDAAEIGVKAVSFVSDGESTCSPHIYDAIVKGKKNGLDMALGTNGYLLKDERLEEILSCLTYLRFNISAAEPSRYAQIMGCKEENFHKVINTIKECVKIKNAKNLSVTLGMQMVLMPDFKDQIIPFAELGKELGVDYAIIKHCSDDEEGNLGVDYTQYFELVNILKEAESHSNNGYLVKAKWSKILSGGKRKYSRCYGPPLIIQFSGSGLVAPCGMLFNNKYKKYHIGNIVETPFKKIWQSDRYWEVVNFIASEKFDARTMCGSLCLQHKVNEFLWDLKHGNAKLEEPKSEPPMHINFI